MIKSNETNTNEEFQVVKARIGKYTEEHRGKCYWDRWPLDFSQSSRKKSEQNG